MTRYLFTAIGFPAGGSGRLPGRKIVNRQLYTKGEIHKNTTTIQKRRIHKIEKKHTKRENQNKSILKKIMEIKGVRIIENIKNI